LLAAEAGLALPEHDLRGEADAEERLAELSRAEAEAPFDLMRGPLVRGRLVRLSDEEHVLLLTQHHIVSDGWSMEVLLRELSALYAGFSDVDQLSFFAIVIADPQLDIHRCQHGRDEHGEQRQDHHGQHESEAFLI